MTDDPRPVVTLRPVTDQNRAEIEALEVTATQSEYVTGVADSLVEAAVEPDAVPWFRAVYADDEPVGFLMLSDGITVENPDYLRRHPRARAGRRVRRYVRRLPAHPDRRVLGDPEAARPCLRHDVGLRDLFQRIVEQPHPTLAGQHAAPVFGS